MSLDTLNKKITLIPGIGAGLYTVYSDDFKSNEKYYGANVRLDGELKINDYLIARFGLGYHYADAGENKEHLDYTGLYALIGIGFQI